MEQRRDTHFTLERRNVAFAINGKWKAASCHLTMKILVRDSSLLLAQ